MKLEFQLSRNKCKSSVISVLMETTERCAQVFFIYAGKFERSWNAEMFLDVIECHYQLQFQLLDFRNCCVINLDIAFWRDFNTRYRKEVFEKESRLFLLESVGEKHTLLFYLMGSLGNVVVNVVVVAICLTWIMCYFAERNIMYCLFLSIWVLCSWKKRKLIE